MISECGARSIILDLVFSEPRPPELRLPDFTQFETIEGEVDQLGTLGPENAVFPDDELAAAIRRCARWQGSRRSGSTMARRRS